MGEGCLFHCEVARKNICFKRKKGFFQKKREKKSGDKLAGIKEVSNLKIQSKNVYD